MKESIDLIEAEIEILRRNIKSWPDSKSIPEWDHFNIGVIRLQKLEEQVNLIKRLWPK